MLVDAYGVDATPAARSICGLCSGDLIAKCGPLVIWHWAHRAIVDCDPWAAGETDWHRQWKRHLRDHHGAQVEVPMGGHRADAVLPSGTIVELQASYLSAVEIVEREQFYGPTLTWLYRCGWHERLHVTRHGFWWKHGARSMATHRQPVWWDVEGGLARVRLSVVETDEGAQRILGMVTTTSGHDLDRCQAQWSGQQMSLL